MKKGFIYLLGQIGNFEAEKGVELIDVVEQVNKQGEVDEYFVLINGPGGVVEVGYNIEKYINNLPKPVNKVIHQRSASIDSIISTSKAKKGGKRYIIKGSEVFVHNPWTIQAGDADTMIETGNSLRETEDEMIKFYMEHTGQAKEAIVPLMSNETSLTDEQALKLNFVDEIITIEQAKEMGFELEDQPKLAHVALLKTKNEDMDLSKIYASLQELHKKIKGEKEEPSKTLDLKANDGTVLSIQTEAPDAKIGDTVFISGKQSPEKSYTLENGDVIKVDAQSKIIEIVPKEVEKNKDVEALKTENENLKKEVAALKLAKENDEKLVKEINEKIVVLNREIKSSYKPEIFATGFRSLKADISGAGSEAVKNQREKLKNRKPHQIK